MFRAQRLDFRCVQCFGLVGTAIWLYRLLLLASRNESHSDSSQDSKNDHNPNDDSVGRAPLKLDSALSFLSLVFSAVREGPVGLSVLRLENGSEEDVPPFRASPPPFDDGFDKSSSSSFGTHSPGLGLDSHKFAQNRTPDCRRVSLDILVLFSFEPPPRNDTVFTLDRPSMGSHRRKN